MKLIAKCPQCSEKIHVADTLSIAQNAKERLKKGGAALVIQCPKCGSCCLQLSCKVNSGV